MNQHEESIDSDEKDFKSLEDVVISGDLLWKVIYSLDSNFFRATRPSSISGAMSEAWVCRFSSYKKMYNLIVREKLRKSMKKIQFLICRRFQRMMI
ncbi:hypothetical protein BY996DRAFT_4047971 [Phakopsora pachyrhizi]|nr:hypothetical protein BY996DRAFT_4047971 [Phakopsora pachyrhizi]